MSTTNVNLMRGHGEKSDISGLRRSSLICFIKAESASTTLDFALSLFFFMTIVLTLAQISFILHARMIVQYAAASATRSAVVWIPQRTVNELPNQMASPESSVKWEHIHEAAAIACIPLAPRISLFSLAGSGNSGLGEAPELPPKVMKLAEGVDRAFRSTVGSSWAVRFAEKWMMSRKLTSVFVAPPKVGDTYEPDELILVRVTHLYQIDIPGPFTLAKPYFEISDSTMLPNNGERSYPSAE